MIDRRLLVCAVASVVAHLLLGRALAELPGHDSDAPPHIVEIRVVAPPEPPPPEPLKPPEPSSPEQVVTPPKERVRARSRAREQTVTTPSDRPVKAPTVEGAPTSSETGKPVFGVTMESTSKGGGPAMNVGTTTDPDGSGSDTGEPAGSGGQATAAAADVTRMPIPQGGCSGKYTEAARDAGIEGTVILDLTVDETGRARDIKVVTGQDHGLTGAAIAALRECRFSPGEKDGKRVPVRVRGFKIRFVLDDP